MKKYIVPAITTIIVLVALTGTYLHLSHVPQLNGMDISHHNKVDWAKIENSGIEFCYIKATEGKSFRDPMCRRHFKKAKQLGLHTGLYHYFRTDVPAEQQFRNFQSVAKGMDFNLVPAIDVEQQGNDFSDTEEVNRNLRELIRLFENEYGSKPLIYAGSWCCMKTIPVIYDCQIWLSILDKEKANYVPNTAIKQVAIIDNLDMNYCKDIESLIVEQEKGESRNEKSEIE